MGFNSERMFVFQNRRERISERLKILQELVPNGCKVGLNFLTCRSWHKAINDIYIYVILSIVLIMQVDLVTMLEKAITYVKFLQLQVKVWHQHFSFNFFLFSTVFKLHSRGFISWDLNSGVGDRWILAGSRWESSRYFSS